MYSRSQTWYLFVGTINMLRRHPPLQQPLKSDDVMLYLETKQQEEWSMSLGRTDILKSL